MRGCQIPVFLRVYPIQIFWLKLILLEIKNVFLPIASWLKLIKLVKINFYEHVLPDQQPFVHNELFQKKLFPRWIIIFNGIRDIENSTNIINTHWLFEYENGYLPQQPVVFSMTHFNFNIPLFQQQLISCHTFAGISFEW